MTMTTIYGRDTNPTTPGALGLAGYNTADAFPFLSGEHIIGPSGTTYTAGTNVPQFVRVSDLPSLLGPSADLSIFSGLSGFSVLVFQTQMPFQEALMPEPASLSFIGMGATACLTRRRRR